MKNIYLYVMDTLADWEIGFVSAELNSRRFFKKDAEKINFKTVSTSKEPVKTMGGLTVIPDLTLKDILVDSSAVLILPGGNTWGDTKNFSIINIAKDVLSQEGTVCAICGATVALANFSLLDNVHHTSNGKGFLDMVAPNYKGQSLYINEPSVTDGNIITAGCHGALELARQIIAHLNVFSEDTLQHWYNYFNTGNASEYFALMQSLPSDKDKN